jgi:hypothetical protein
MKVVKLNRRFKQYKDHGHTVALRFSNWSHNAQTVEKIASSRLGGGGWDRDGNWCSYFGARNGHSDRLIYWITFRRESDLTLVLLSAQLTNNA